MVSCWRGDKASCCRGVTGAERTSSGVKAHAEDLVLLTGMGEPWRRRGGGGSCLGASLGLLSLTFCEFFFLDTCGLLAPGVLIWVFGLRNLCRKLRCLVLVASLATLASA